MSEDDIRSLCGIFYNLPADELYSIDVHKFAFLSPIKGLCLLGAVDSICRSIIAVRGEQERLHFVATLYSWLIPRDVHTGPWALFQNDKFLLLDASEIGSRLVQTMRSLESSAVEGAFDAGAAWCLAILTRQEADSTCKYAPICVNVWKGLPFLAVHFPEMTRFNGAKWPLLACVVGDLEKCFRGFHANLASARSAATRSR